MSAAALVAFLTGLVEAAEKVPDLIVAVERVVGALRTKQDPTPAIKYAEALLAAHELGLDPSKV